MVDLGLFVLEASWRIREIRNDTSRREQEDERFVPFPPFFFWKEEYNEWSTTLSKTDLLVCRTRDGHLFRRVGSHQFVSAARHTRNPARSRD